MKWGKRILCIALAAAMLLGSLVLGEIRYPTESIR